MADGGSRQALERWRVRAASARLPVDRLVREALAAMGEQGLAEIEPEDVAEVAARDPALVLQVIRSANAVEHLHLDADVGTIRHATLMLGTARLFQLIREMPALEATLEGPALAGYRAAELRARRAGTLAEDWAGMRADQLPEEVHVAALTCLLGELVAWAWEPAAMTRVEEAVAEGIAPEDAEYIVLGCTLVRIGATIARFWNMPPLGVQALDPASALQPRAYGVMLAVELARALDRGWAAPGTREALAQASAWLELPQAELEERCRAVLDEAGIGVSGDEAPAATAATAYLLAPRPDLYDAALARLDAAAVSGAGLDEKVEAALDAVHEGLGMNRVVYARLVRHGEALRAHRSRGTEHSPAFNRFELPLWGEHLFGRLVEDGGCLRVAEADTSSWASVPAAVKELVGVPVFLAAAVRPGGRTVGLLYADRRHPEAPIREVDLEGFRRVVERLEAALGGGDR